MSCGSVVVYKDAASTEAGPSARHHENGATGGHLQIRYLVHSPTRTRPELSLAGYDRERPPVRTPTAAQAGVMSPSYQPEAMSPNFTA